MKLCVKKIYCHNCQRLVGCEEQKADSTIRVLCSRCKQLLRVWDGISWKITRESA